VICQVHECTDRVQYLVIAENTVPLLGDDLGSTWRFYVCGTHRARWPLALYMEPRQVIRDDGPLVPEMPISTD
jgi:hypothetical protein